MVGAILIVALVGPLLFPVEYMAPGDLADRFSPPSWGHPLGTDQLDRDVLFRLIHGARTSILISLLAVSLGVGLGAVMGAGAGYLRGRADTMMSGLVDVVLAFPTLVLLITVGAFLGRSTGMLILILALVQWPQAVRVVRGETLRLRDVEFVQAARVLGFSDLRIIMRHLLPNMISVIAVLWTLGIGRTIVMEAGLSYLGLGLPADVPSWGGMIADGQTSISQAWWLATFPGLAVVLVVISFNLLGEGLRLRFDRGSEA